MSTKKNVFANTSSKRRVTVQLRGYDHEGFYEGSKEDAPRTYQVKNATEEEVTKCITEALEKQFGA